MHPTWKKMQIKDRSRFLVLSPPKEFDAILADRDATWTLDQRATVSAAGNETYDVVVIFVKDPPDVAGAAQVIRSHVAGDDTLLWICYTKKSSKKFAATINRDAGWEGVRQIAVDDDWPALRFRLREAISRYTRQKTIGKSP